MSGKKDPNKGKREWRRQLHPPPKMSKQNAMLSRSRRTLDEDSESESRISESAQTDLQIVLVGKSGSGMSSAGNIILGQECFKTDVSPESVTKICERGEVKIHERNICVIDTPGLFDTTEEEMTAETVKCVDLSAPGPHVFLLVIRLDVRLTGEEKSAVKLIQQNFGEEASRYTIILFTHEDHLKGKSVEEFIRENKDLQALVDECGGRFHSFNNKDMKNRSQVTELMKKIEEMLENVEECYDDKTSKQDQKKNEQTQKTKQEENDTNPEILKDEVEAAIQTNRAGEPQTENKGVPQQETGGEKHLGVSSQEVGEVTQKYGGVSQEYKRVNPPEDGGNVARPLGSAVKVLLVALASVVTVAIAAGVSVAVGVAAGFSVAAGGGLAEAIAGVGVVAGVAAGIAVTVRITKTLSAKPDSAKFDMFLHQHPC